MTTYNLYDIVKCVIKSKSPKEYIKKVKSKEFVYGYYLIKKDDLIVILEKTKSIAGKNLLVDLNNNKETGYELSKDDLIVKYNNSQTNYFDIGTQLINYEECKIRYLYDDKANIYFRAKDICNILGYLNTNDAIIKHINEEDKLTYNNIQSLSTATPLGIEVESENTIYINETGLYTLMLSSQQKQAIKFKNWVCKDVLPSIRKQGYYKLNKKFDLNQYHKRNCFYIFKGSGSFYKLGITKDINRRISSHKADGLLKDDSQIVEIFILDNYNELMTVERDIKNFICKNGYLYELKNYTELFKSEFYDIVVSKIKELISKTNIKNEKNLELNISQSSLEFLKLQNIKIDKELEIEKTKLELINKEIELVKLKNNNKTINNINLIKNKSIYNNHENNKNKCRDCKKEIKFRATRCLNCENKNRFLKGTGKRPSFEQLIKDKIELKSNVKIGKKYGVSDNAVRKWFKIYDKYGYKFKIVLD